MLYNTANKIRNYGIRKGKGWIVRFGIWLRKVSEKMRWYL